LLWVIDTALALPAARHPIAVFRRRF